MFEANKIYLLLSDIYVLKLLLKKKDPRLFIGEQISSPSVILK